MRNHEHVPADNADRRLSDGLDYYKLTMGQVAHERYPDAQVTFTLKNRAGDRPLSQYVDPDRLTDRLGEIRDKGFTPEEIAYFAGLQASDGSARFDEPYLDYLDGLRLSDVAVGLDPLSGDLTVQTTGEWANASLWETVVMSEVNEIYYREYCAENGLDVADVQREGDRRLDEKIRILREHPEIKFADFGTRRRFSRAWHEHVVGRLAREVPDNFTGTSNPWFAYRFGLDPVGTYAHEMPMVYAGLSDEAGADPLDGHGQMMRDWQERYDGDLSIALTDTFGSDFFFADMTDDQARQWKGLRHDSGDPVEFGERAIAFYKERGIDPHGKTIVFSDGLDIATIVALADHFAGRVNVLFGWGTSLMNDLGPKANNFVMKATHVNGTDTVKLSDDAGKHTGPEDLVARYEQLAADRVRLGGLALTHV